MRSSSVASRRFVTAGSTTAETMSAATGENGKAVLRRRLDRLLHATCICSAHDDLLLWRRLPPIPCQVVAYLRKIRFELGRHQAADTGRQRFVCRYPSVLEGLKPPRWTSPKICPSDFEGLVAST